MHPVLDRQSLRVLGLTQPVTSLLRQWAAGDEAARDKVVPIVYDALKRIADAYLRRESSASLTTTELVAEAYERLCASDAQWNDRVHFFAVAARHMRQILVDHARRHHAAKRGGGLRPLPLDETAIVYEQPGEMLALDEALDALAALDERKARMVEMYYFAGMTHEEIGTVIGVHGTTIARELRFALAWLRQKLER
jgi:RNA polymerase sigma factor (TIGR02999 family)